MLIKRNIKSNLELAVDAGGAALAYFATLYIFGGRTGASLFEALDGLAFLSPIGFAGGVFLGVSAPQWALAFFAGRLVLRLWRSLLEAGMDQALRIIDLGFSLLTGAGFMIAWASAVLASRSTNATLLLLGLCILAQLAIRFQETGTPRLEWAPRTRAAILAFLGTGGRSAHETALNRLMFAIGLFCLLYVANVSMRNDYAWAVAAQTIPSRAVAQFAPRAADPEDTRDAAPLPVAEAVKLTAEQQSAIAESEKAGTLSYGTAQAPIRIVEFLDLECPYCRKANTTVNDLIANYPGRVFLTTFHFPLSFHSQAVRAAEALEAAGEQGKYWSYRHRLFALQENKPLNESLLNEVAEQVGLDVGRFKAALASAKFKNKVDHHLALGQKLGVSGTPTYFVNGQIIKGSQPMEIFVAAIEKELQSDRPDQAQ